MKTSVTKRTWILVVAVLGLLMVVPRGLPRVGVSAQGGPVAGQPGIIAAYGFEEGTGTTTTDATGNGNAGTISGATWSTSGKNGKALSFNGSSNWVTIADAGPLDVTLGVTLEAWVRPTTNSGWRTAILKETPDGLAYALYTSDGARPSGHVFTSTEYSVPAVSALALNTWTHIANTYDGATLRVYVNGVQVSSKSVTGLLTTSANPLRIGGNAPWGEYFSGLIDDVRVYGRALSLSEIQADMNAAVAAADVTPPTVSLVSPAGSSTNVPVAGNVSATFSEAMTASTINASTFELRNAANQVVAATVTYNSSTFTATLDPTADLAGSSTYTATVRGGATDPRVMDASGNALASNIAWTFTTIAIDTVAPTVAGVSPSSGAANVSANTNVTATFSEAMTAATINGTTFELRDAANQPVAAAVTYNPATLTATLDPASDLAGGVIYTATVRGGAADPRVKDAAGNALAANAVWSFMTVPAVPVCPCSIWPATTVPGTPDFNDPGAVEVGVKFMAERDGAVTGVRFYKGAGNVGTHVGNLWTAAGVLLASGTFVNETATGWQQMEFPSHINVAANTTYVVSYHAPNGHYAVDAGFFNSAVDNPPLHAIGNGVSPNGIFKYSATPGAFPDQSFGAGNYWVDVVYTDNTDSVAPVVSSVTPASGATNIATTTAITATFSENVDPLTINATTFELRTPANAPVAATVTYNAATRVATLQPSAALTAVTVYTATVRGGAADPRVRDTAGNALAANMTWSFTTAAAAPVVTGQSPANGVSNVVITTAVTATFDVAIDATTISTSTFELRTPANALVAASVSYNAATRTATVQPSAALAYSTVYTATVRGGAAAPRVVSAAGTALAANVVWSFTTAAAPPVSSCPCSIWTAATTPGTAASTDTASVEVGVKFQSDRSGFISGIRFYKGATNTGTHVGSLWTAAGVLLGSVSFDSETASGWQQANFPSPIAISANTVYIASYYAPVGRYAVNATYFTAAVDKAPLRALANATSTNGVYRYTSVASTFPNLSFQSSNYWVDVVFSDATGPDTAPPVLSGLSPASGTTNVVTSTAVTTTFNEPMDPATISTATIELRTPANALVPATVTYNAATRTATLQPTALLPPSTVYTVTIRGGSTDPRVKDAAGNALAANATWSFTTLSVPADDGPGGPVLVIASTANPFGRSYGEILRNEGLNLFTVTDISLVSAATLSAYDVVILGEMPLTASQVSMFTSWVTSGGNLIAMRPDKQLAGLLGLTDAAATRSNAYLLMDTAGAATGLVNQSIQYHGAADLYTVSGATAVATLYSNATTATANPAVTMRSIGSSGGQAVAFAFDLARSIALTRQGNPAWSGQDRDGSAPVRSDDLFFGAAAGDSQIDWVDFNKIAIPQADEQQRLLANLILLMSADRKPLPRLWYLPRGLKAAVVMTGDDHGNNGTAGRWDRYKALSPAGCSVDDWQCVRGTSYIYPSTPITNARAAAYDAEGFEVGLHLSTNCADYTPATLPDFYSSQLTTWKAKYTSLPAPVTNRTHCIVWSDYVTQPKVELSNNIRLDTNYYYWPAAWVQDRPGFFTGSGMPMRFADLDGSTIDVYQAASQLTDESNQTFPFTIDTLLDRALGAEGYYGVFTANMHTDTNPHAPSEATVASALARGVPIVTARQMLTWLDGRNGSSFTSLTWAGGALSFNIVQGSGANGLQAMLPESSTSGSLTSLSLNGSAVAFTVQTIKGVSYAIFTALGGSYTALYTALPNTTITSSPAATTTSTSAGFSFTGTPSDATFQCALDGAAFAACSSPSAYSELATGGHSFQVRAVNETGTDPTPASFAWTIGTQTTALPTAATVSTGTLQSGSTVSNLTADDNVYHQVNSTTSNTRTATYYASFTAPNSLLSLTASYIGRNTQSSCTQVLELFRWSDSTWVQIDSRTVGTTETAVLNVAAGGVLADYVSGSSGNGEVRVRVRTTRSGFTNFSSQGDLISITFTQ